MGPKAEDIGGNRSRSVSVHVDTGRVVLSSPGAADWEI
jgi:chemotaxis protein CheD